ncbi:hemolysin III, putative [Plasmodium ovale]|uniref:Hemolysin III, putative n=1 Tax=Plasmodium ovale TaxID=36330 RepID=A0A1C3KW05_PLAOA|nr:hemolysin III, putative [Plasmodium ovale]
MRHFGSYFTMGYYKKAFTDLKKYYKSIDIFDVSGTTDIDDNTIMNFLKSENLEENDKKIVELYLEKKINKPMLIKYMERKDRTLFRGKIHLFMVFSSPLWIFYMLYLSKTLTSKIFTSISVLCIFFNSFASFLLHNFDWKPKLFFLIEKMDHIGIFLMISGSCIPVPALLFDKMKLLVYITLHFLCVFFGSLFICCSCFSSGNRITRSCTFLVAGFVHAAFVMDFYSALYTREFIFLILLAVQYIVGAIIYSIKKPNVISGIIEFHDVFHICCLGSVLCTFALNSSVIKRRT